MLGAEPTAKEKGQAADVTNPTMARRERNATPSAPTSGSKRTIADNDERERPSVRAAILEMKQERKEQAKQQPAPQQQRANQHKQPERKRTQKTKEDR